jgi:SAM-dependent methyltransferase
MHHRLIACPICDLLYASPVPERGELAKAYEEAAFDSGAEARYASRTYGRFLPGICRRLPDLDGALDIGTGDGAFLQELLVMKFDRIAGVEPSRAPIAAAAPSVKPLIRQGFFDPKDFEPGTFSLITCFQTMEHVDAPMALCRGAMTLLRPGGALFLIGHNRRALSAKLMGRKSPIFDVEHLQLFSKFSALEMMRRAGFSDIRVTSFVNRYPLHYWMKLLPMPARVKLGLIRFVKAIKLGYLPLPLLAGNMAIVGFRPRTADHN